MNRSVGSVQNFETTDLVLCRKLQEPLQSCYGAKSKIITTICMPTALRIAALSAQFYWLAFGAGLIDRRDQANVAQAFLPVSLRFLIF